MFAQCLNLIHFTMTRKSFILSTVLVFILTVVSCSDSNSNSLPGNDDKELFNPSCIVIDKSKGDISSKEIWSSIEFDKNGNIKSFVYTFEKNGIVETAKRHIISGVTENREMIANIDILDKDGNTTKSLLEISRFNNQGFISEIRSIVTSGEGGSSTLQTTEMNFEYSNSGLCRRFTYNDEECNVICEYEWSGYRLSRATENIIYKGSGRKETNIYRYTFDNKNSYPYNGISMFPFIQNERETAVVPQIYASMGYLGVAAPGILMSETQERHVTTNNEMGPGWNSMTQRIEKVYDFTKKNSRGEVKYYISSTDTDTNTDLYDNYTVTFIE